MREALRAAGYLFILLPPAILALSVALDVPWLAFAVTLGGLPLVRPIFGDAPAEPPVWSEKASTFLDGLPIGAAALVIAAIGSLIWHLSTGSVSGGAWIWWGLSLWAVCIFGSCIAHELVHRRQLISRQAGRLLSGAIGYPLLEHEHRAHHGASGNVEPPEWPRVDENVWQFSARRFPHVVRAAWEGDVVASVRAGHRLAGGLPLAVLAFVATAAAFFVFGGLAGLCLYLAVAVGTAWAMQAVTYVQHWGLGADSVANADEGQFGWEDRCQAQVWLTLGISYHQAHHHGSSVPYYRQAPLETAPRAPAGYVVLLVACLFPPLWRALMLPALERWRASPENQIGVGRRLFCLVR